MEPPQDSRFSFAAITTSENKETKETETSQVTKLSLSMNEALKLGNVEAFTDIGQVKLTCFWKRIGKNQFCLPDGGVINSDTTVSDYLAAALPHYTDKLKKLAENEKVPTYTICYKESIPVPSAKLAGDVPLDLTLHTFENKPREFSKLPSATVIEANAIATAPSAPGSRPGKMTTHDWNEVIVVNSLLNGVCVGGRRGLHKARRTAFKLEPNPVNPLMFSPGTLPRAGLTSMRVRAQEASKMSAIESVERGLEPAFPKTPEAAKAGVVEEAHDALPEPLEHLYPQWEVCDDSCIKIETISTTLQLASAQQGFSSASIEAAVSLSVSSIEAGASAGFATSSKTAASKETGSKSEQMHATYEFPRVRLFLDEESISLSSDCAAAIKNIRDTRSYAALLDFYRDYGHLYVTSVKLGGRLRATRFLSAEESNAMGSTENAWKASIAASFSVSLIASGSVKGQAENATAAENRRAASALNESVCWEANGGNTTLANNPSAWCSTVENFWYWRIVEQEVIVPIEDVISKLEGFRWTRQLFASITIDAMFQSTPMEIQWNKDAGLSLGAGILATGKASDAGNIVRGSALDIDHSGFKNVPVDSQPESQWSVIANNRDLHLFLTDIFAHTINPYVATKLMPNVVWRLAVSDRAFSVVLRTRRNTHRFTAPFITKNMEIDSEDECCGDEPVTPETWRTTYGDFYVNSSVIGTVATVAWVFMPQTADARQFERKRAVSKFLTAPLPSLEICYAYLARLAMDIPCETYVYDAYYNETKLSSPSSVLSVINGAEKKHGGQVISVGLASYRDREDLQALTGLTVASPVPSVPLATVRKDHVDYAFQAIKRRSDTTPIDTSLDISKTWASDFSSAAYMKSGLVDDYNALYNRQDIAIQPRLERLSQIWGLEQTLERTLRWLRLSRRAEAQQLSSPLYVYHTHPLFASYADGHVTDPKPMSMSSD
jgi:hypothetical protein